MMEDPTRGQAEMFGRLIFAGIPSVEAVPFVAPFLDAAVVPDVARAWPKSKPVLDVWVELLGGPWVDLTDAQKIEQAVAYARRCQAWVVMSQNPQELPVERRVVYFACLKDLAAVQAGAGGGGDASTAYFEQALKTLQAKGKLKAEAH